MLGRFSMVPVISLVSLAAVVSFGQGLQPQPKIDTAKVLQGAIQASLKNGWNDFQHSGLNTEFGTVVEWNNKTADLGVMSPSKDILTPLYFFVYYCTKTTDEDPKSDCTDKDHPVGGLVRIGPNEVNNRLCPPTEKFSPSSQGESRVFTPVPDAFYCVKNRAGTYAAMIHVDQVTDTGIVVSVIAAAGNPLRQSLSPAPKVPAQR